MTSDFDHEILIIDESNCDQRIDKLVADTFDLLSRTLVQRLIDEGLITCKGKRVKAGYRTCNCAIPRAFRMSFPKSDAKVRLFLKLTNI